jgi:hypothetical protein
VLDDPSCSARLLDNRFTMRFTSGEERP